jgi:hypothetical protein
MTTRLSVLHVLEQLFVPVCGIWCWFKERKGNDYIRGPHVVFDNACIGVFMALAGGFASGANMGGTYFWILFFWLPLLFYHQTGYNNYVIRCIIGQHHATHTLFTLPLLVS